jgi:hypothetical protein
LTTKRGTLSCCGFSPNSNLEFKGEIEMDDIFDDFDWEDMGMIGGMLEEFTEDEMELLRIEKDHDEWKNENLDTFS